MSIILYDLCAKDPGVRFSPFCWAAKFALLHKGLDFEAAPLGFTEKENYPDSEYGRLPQLKDGDTLIKDSGEICTYLDDAYPGKPLLASKAEAASLEFYRAWLGNALFPGLAPLMFGRVHAVIRDGDQEYFRQAREKAFGKTLEELAASVEAPKKVESALEVLAAPLTKFSFLGGDQPNLVDYVVASPLVWKCCITDQILYDTPEAVEAWFERILDLFDGAARHAPRAMAA